MANPFDLSRFHDAQTGRCSGFPSYEKAFQEIEKGRKNSHWIWYVLPQLEELGMSLTAKKYGLKDLQETCAYLQDPVLFTNYQKMIEKIIEKIAHGSDSIRYLMGSDIDASKLMSSMTLFKATATYLIETKGDPKKIYSKFKTSCDLLFDSAAQEGLYPCNKTLTLLKPELEKTKVHSTAVTTKSPEKAKSSTFFTTPKTEQPKKVQQPTPLIATLDKYINTRKNEWSFHYNFIGLVSVLYFIQDRLQGTDHFNNKSKEVKIVAATKLRNWLSSPDKEQPQLSAAEKIALQEGRLGKIVTQHGNLDSLIQQQIKNNSEFKFSPGVKF